MLSLELKKECKKPGCNPNATACHEEAQIKENYMYLVWYLGEGQTSLG
jgi:hypothetical protein